jgi:hypothetical protein
MNGETSVQKNSGDNVKATGKNLPSNDVSGNQRHLICDFLGVFSGGFAHAQPQ